MEEVQYKKRAASTCMRPQWAENSRSAKSRIKVALPKRPRLFADTGKLSVAESRTDIEKSHLATDKTSSKDAMCERL